METWQTEHHYHEQRRWEVAVELAAAPLVYGFTAEELASAPAGRVTCAYCGAVHPFESDARTWTCCAERGA